MNLPRPEGVKGPGHEQAEGAASHDDVYFGGEEDFIGSCF